MTMIGEAATTLSALSAVIQAAKQRCSSGGMLRNFKFCGS
jgi:hypothetical protein